LIHELHDKHLHIAQWNVMIYCAMKPHAMVNTMKRKWNFKANK